MRKRVVFTGGSLIGLALVTWYHSPFTQKEPTQAYDKTISDIRFDESRTIKSKQHIDSQTHSQLRSQAKNVEAFVPNNSIPYVSAKYGPLAASLRGTKIPAYFELDSKGNLIITSSIKSLIEYFLSAQGEESLETAIGRIQEYFKIQLSEPAATQAIYVLAEYIQYKEALIELEHSAADNNPNTTNDYTNLFERRKEVRQSNLSPEVYDAFFSEEDKLDTYTAKILTLQKEKRLTSLDSEKTHSDLINTLPYSEQLIKNKELTRNKIAEAKNNGATKEELFQLRQDAFGYEAAERFARADEKQKLWEARYQEYRNLRHSINSNDGLSTYDKDQAIGELQALLFDQYERKRLPTLDKIADKQETL